MTAVMSSSSRLMSPPPPPSRSTNSNSKPLSHSPSKSNLNGNADKLTARLRSWTATRSKKPAAVLAQAVDSGTSKGKERETIKENKGKSKEKDKEKPQGSGMLRRLESRVNFRRSGSGKEVAAAAVVPGNVGYTTPSLRMGSMSSPALQLFSPDSPSPSNSPIPTSPSKSRPAIPTTSSRRISSPFASPSPRHTHRPSRSTPINIPPSSSVVSLSSPATPQRASSTSHLPLNSPPSPTSPTSPTSSRPLRRRSDRDPEHNNRDESPSPVHRRPISPTQRSYAHNRHFSISNTSLASPTGPSNPEHRELIRTATALLCRESLKPPAYSHGHWNTEAGKRDWDGVEVRMRALVRLERIWGKSGSGGASGSNLNVNALSSSGLSASGEEREKRLFGEALRDGYVLCHLLNKLRPSSPLVRPDPNDDRLSPSAHNRTSNISKFLNAASSFGLSEEELFTREDLVDGTQEGLARVAKTVLKLAEVREFAVRDGAASPGTGMASSSRAISPTRERERSRTRILTGTDKRSTPSPVSGPYKLGNGTSTPNLLASSGSNSNSQPQPRSPSHAHSNSVSVSGQGGGSSSPPQRKRWSPPNLLPTVMSGSGSGSGGSEDGTMSKATSKGGSGLKDKDGTITKSTKAKGAESTGTLIISKSQFPRSTINNLYYSGGSSNSDVKYSNSNGNANRTGGKNQKSLSVTVTVTDRVPADNEDNEFKVDGPSRAGGDREEGKGKEKAKAKIIANQESIQITPAPNSISTPTSNSIPTLTPPPPRSPLRARPPPLSISPSSVSPQRQRSIQRQPASLQQQQKSAEDDLFTLAVNNANVSNSSSSSPPRRVSASVSGSAPTASDSYADSIRASIGDSSFASSSVANSPVDHSPNSNLYNSNSNVYSNYNPSPSRNIRQSIVSSTSGMTDTTTTTTTTVVSSLLGFNSNKYDKSYDKDRFGTIRTMTTEATSVDVGEGDGDAGDIGDGEWDKLDRDRKLSVSGDVAGAGAAGTVVDLSRVEEVDENSSSGGVGFGFKNGNSVNDRGGGGGRGGARSPTTAIRLGKGKWPDDFMDAMQNHFPSHSPSPSSPYKSSSPPLERNRSTSLSKSLALAGGGPSVESLPLSQSQNQQQHQSQLSPPVAHAQFPRRPSNRARHTIDAATGIQPKDRESSPNPRRQDSLVRHISPSPNQAPRRHNSTNPNPRQGDGSDSDNLTSSKTSSNPVLVPFPRAVSGGGAVAGGNLALALAERDASASGSGSRSPSRSHVGIGLGRPPRGRFQSDITVEGPNSYDELGGLGGFSHSNVVLGLGAGNGVGNGFGGNGNGNSMVNLGSTSGNTKSRRDSIEGNMVRKPLIIKEEGKVATHFQLGNCIGRGQFGSVYRALNLNTGQMVAVKRIRLEGLKEEEVMQLMREVDLVKRLSHPSIIKYEGMHRDKDTLSIVLEYAENGSLGQTVKAFGKLNEKLVASYVVRILEGLHYLHQSDVVHCDLKAANILTTKNGNVKLSDFGVSLNMRAVEREKDVAGTPNWMAPEVIELKGASPKSDIWSLACTVIELLTGKPPYGDIPNSMSVMFRIVEDDVPPIPPGVSPLLEDFLKKCFHKDPAQRPTAELLCEHQWLKQSWGGYKELRPQDSIPFLRRVSADLQKSEVVRYLSQIEMPESTPEYPRDEDMISGSPPGRAGRKMSNSSIRPSADNNDISPREHSFVKTTFSKPMVCRVCLFHVKKNAVLCAQCSLICHSKCAINAPPTCDLRAQLLLYAQYAEKGHLNSAYSNPADILGDAQPKSPMSDVAWVSHTPRTSLDTAPPLLSPSGMVTPTPDTPTTSTSMHPPVAFKFMNFKRSKTSKHAATDPVPPSSASATSSSTPAQTSQPVTRKHMVLRKAGHGDSDRAPSVKSNSTHNNSSSMRSAGTVASAGARLSFAAVGGGESDAANRASRVTTQSGASDADEAKMPRMPGELSSDEHRRHRKTKSSNCIVQ
ncbi:hypothetical protein BDP27DRAFT_1315932 [Rhodocollybia butyracea]|uniref:Uncharacterized protein n=1 Tax=Rhodocollybia butyracea TaxID=206335 RepID=A0A9P5Q671_9AGAR|nr:hypothetical protein BDP27DRAFT_1315932 [Rhodocollybia butyracea]